MSRLIGIIQIALSLVIVCGLVIGCAVPSAESPSQPPEQQVQNIATVTDMTVSNWSFKYDYALCVYLEPTSSALANETYLVELSEKGNFRDSTTVRWNQPEINVKKEKVVQFPIARAEWDAYFMEDISHIFSVKVVGKSPKMDERLWERIIEEASH